MRATVLKNHEDCASISLVLPAWNESATISQAVEEADNALRALTDDYEIIVVDDGSTDDTAKIVSGLIQTNTSIRLIRLETNGGYGAALRNGFQQATKDLVAFTDADCQFDLTELDRFVLLSKRYDIICGYRIDRKDTPLRCLYSRVYNQISRLLLNTGVRDIDCALKMFHRKAIQSIETQTAGFLINTEVVTRARQAGRSIVEVGVSHRYRAGGTSSVSISHIPKVLAALLRFWWNGVLFSQQVSSNVSSEGHGVNQSAGEFSQVKRRARWMQFGLLCLAAVVLFANLGYPLIDRDETRYAEIPREMIATGNWTLPQLNFQTYYDKPPLVYWLSATCYKLFGISEVSARLVPTFAAFFMIAATMWFGSRIFDHRVGLVSGGVLALSAGFALVSRYLLLDGVLALFVTLSMFGAYEAMRTKRLLLRWWVFSSIFCGLAVLTKGPIGMVLLLPPVFAYGWLTDTATTPKLKHYGLMFAIVGIVVAPWLVAVSMKDPGFVMEFLVRHNLSRFAGEFHGRPVWFFVPVLLIAGHPWTFLTIPYVKYLFSRTNSDSATRPRSLGFLLLWSAWCFVFFSVSRCKLPTYLLPIAPALALMIGHYLTQVIEKRRNDENFSLAAHWSPRAATICTCFAAIGFLLFQSYITAGAEVVPYKWVTVWVLLLIASVLFWRAVMQRYSAWAVLSCVSVLFCIVLLHECVPAYSRSQTLFGVRNELSLRFDENKSVAIATVAHEFSEVPFYLGRSDITNVRNIANNQLVDFINTKGNAILFVDNDISLAELKARLPEGSEIVVIGKRGPANIFEVSTDAYRLAKRDDGSPMK